RAQRPGRLRWRMVELFTHLVGLLSESFGHFMQAGCVEIVDRGVEMTQAVGHFRRLRGRALPFEPRTSIRPIALDPRRPFASRPESRPIIPVNSSAVGCTTEKLYCGFMRGVADRSCRPDHFVGPAKMHRIWSS